MDNLFNEPTILDNEKIKRSLKGYMDTLVYDYERYAFENKKMLDILHNLRLIFNDGKDCYTNGKNIVIGKKFPVFLKAKSDTELYRMVQGVIAHEVAHILYTDFDKFRSFINRAPGKFKKHSNFAKSIYNILEDYRIESRMGRSSKHLTRLFLMNRALIIKDIIDNSDTKQLRSDQERLEFAMNSMMVTLLNGRRIATKDPKARRLYRKMTKVAQEGIQIGTNDSIEKATENILEILQDLDYDPAKGSISLQFDATSMNRVPGVSGVDHNNNGSNGNDVDAKNDDVFSGSDHGDLDITEANHEGEKEEEKDINDVLNNVIDDNEIDKEDITADIINSYKSKSPSEIPESKIQELHDITNSKELKEFKGIKLVVEKPTRKFNSIEYEHIVDSLSYEVNQTVSQMKEVIEHYQYFEEFEKKSGTLDPSMLSRFVAFNELNIFKKEEVYEDDDTLNISMLIDCSGSNGANVPGMNQPRYKLNQMMSVYFHEVLKKLKFRHSVYGFSSGNAEFIKPIITTDNCFEDTAGENIASIEAKLANRDGYHIRLATERLLKEMQDTNEAGLLIVMSDGLPNCNNYGGPSAMNDVRKAVEEANEKGVKVLGVFTGNENENKYFPEMYEEHFFLNGTSLEDFPKVFRRVVSDAYQEHIN